MLFGGGVFKSGCYDDTGFCGRWLSATGDGRWPNLTPQRIFKESRRCKWLLGLYRASRASVWLPSILASSHHITFEHLIVQEVALLKFTGLLSAVSGPISIISLELLFVFSSILLQCLLSKLASSKHYVDELLQRAIFL